jgi:t-SNARE complex subunit (syntaxin)
MTELELLGNDAHHSIIRESLKRQAKIQKIKNYMILIAMIVIVLGVVLYYFSE